MHVQAWLDYLQWQLDGLTGKVVCGTLRVLPGDDNRPHGGKRLLCIHEAVETDISL